MQGLGKISAGYNEGYIYVLPYTMNTGAYQNYWRPWIYIVRATADALPHEFVRDKALPRSSRGVPFCDIRCAFMIRRFVEYRWST